MKKLLVLLLQVVLFIPVLSSCSDDEPVDSDGFIFLEHGKKYPAQTRVSDDEIMSKLCTGTWTLINGNNWLFYDKKHVSGWGASNSDGGGLFVLSIKFNKDGSCGHFPSPELIKTTFSVKNGHIHIAGGVGYYDWDVKVVAIYQGNLVVDSKPSIEMKGFDTTTLMQRYIWYGYDDQE